MSYTIADLKVDLERKLHGTSLSQIVGVYSIIDEASSDILNDYDAPETKRMTQFSNPIYDDVYSYQLPGDLKKDKIVDIYKQPEGETQVMQVVSNLFRQNKKTNTYNVFYNNAGKTINISKNTGKNATLSTMNSTDGWSVGGDAENLATDNLNYISGGSSLKFDLDGSTTVGYLENSTLTSIDLTDYKEGAGFLYTYLPDASAITNLILRWGNDSSNYWEKTVTTTHEGNSFENGWNLLRFDWDGATEVGTPDESAVDYTRVSTTYNGVAETDIRLDNLVFRLGSIFNIYYYSEYLFRSSAGVWQESVDDDSNIINLEKDSYNLLLNRVYYLASLQLANGNSNFDIESSLAGYVQTLTRLKAQNKSEAQKPLNIYYNI